jgi:hypothetical protein
MHVKEGFMTYKGQPKHANRRCREFFGFFLSCEVSHLQKDPKKIRLLLLYTTQISQNYNSFHSFGFFIQHQKKHKGIYAYN